MESAKIEGGELVYGEEECYCSWGQKHLPNMPKGMVPGRKACPTCHGTRQVPKQRGAKGYKECPKCLGIGSVEDADHPVTCPRCGGTAVVPQNSCSRVSMAWVVERIPFRVVRQDRGVSFNESYLGFGCLWSCGDYGVAWESGDEAILAEVMDTNRHHSTQFINFVRKEDNAVAKWIAIAVNRGGYSVRAVYDSDAPLARAADEVSPVAAMVVGGLLANAGLNGTMIAAAM